MACLYFFISAAHTTANATGWRPLLRCWAMPFPRVFSRMTEQSPLTFLRRAERARAAPTDLCHAPVSRTVVSACVILSNGPMDSAIVSRTLLATFRPDLSYTKICNFSVTCARWLAAIYADSAANWWRSSACVIGIHVHQATLLAQMLCRKNASRMVTSSVCPSTPAEKTPASAAPRLWRQSG